MEKKLNYFVDWRFKLSSFPTWLDFINVLNIFYLGPVIAQIVVGGVFLDDCDDGFGPSIWLLIAGITEFIFYIFYYYLVNFYTNGVFIIYITMYTFMLGWYCVGLISIIVAGVNDDCNSSAFWGCLSLFIIWAITLKPFWWSYAIYFVTKYIKNNYIEEEEEV